MSLPQYDHMVNALAPDRPDQAFGKRYRLDKRFIVIDEVSTYTADSVGRNTVGRDHTNGSRQRLGLGPIAHADRVIIRPSLLHNAIFVNQTRPESINRISQWKALPHSIGLLHQGRLQKHSA